MSITRNSTGTLETNIAGQHRSNQPVIATSLAEAISKVCDVTRILVLGKTGIGKTSLIKHVFQAKDSQDAEPEVSHFEPGKADINIGYFFNKNPNVIFHDSMGFEAGERSNLEAVKRFIIERSQPETPPRDKVHVVWQCVATPTPGDRLIECGDQEIFKLCGDHHVPVVLVFTKYDGLITSMRRKIDKRNRGMSLLQRKEKAKEEATAHRQTTCRELIETAKNHDIPYHFVSTYEPSSADPLTAVVQTSLSCIRSQGPSYQEGEEGPAADGVDETRAKLFQLSSTQCIDSESKIDSSIKSIQSLWKDPFWFAMVGRSSLQDHQCLSAIHYDIVRSWSILEISEGGVTPDFLKGGKFTEEIFELVAELDDRNLPQQSDDLVTVTTLAGDVAEAVSAASLVLAAAFMIAALPIIVGVKIASWAYNKFIAPPVVLRCFMAYIVDLVVVMNMLFVLNKSVSRDDVLKVLEEFRSRKQGEIHQDVKDHVSRRGIVEVAFNQADNLEEIVRLIHKHTKNN